MNAIADKCRGACWWLALACVLGGVRVAYGQDDLRAALVAQRQQAERDFEAQTQACYQRFAVTDCTVAVARAHRARVADIQRQELALDEAERQRRALEQEQRLADKQQQRAQEEAARQSQTPRASASADGGAAPKERLLAQGSARTPTGTPPVRSAAQRARSRDDYAKRQEDAVRRRQERDDRRRAQANQAPVKPLPVPSAPKAEP